MTNDDGVHSPGLAALVEAVWRLGNVKVVSPEEPRSGTSMSLTFHKPLRVSAALVGSRKAYAVSGSPADAIMVAVHKLSSTKPDLVVSGINFGDNTTFQDVYASGTVAAAIEAAIMGIPSIAFSMEVPDQTIFAPVGLDFDFRKAGSVAAEIARWVLDTGLPPGVQLLNVNFPRNIRESTPVQVTRLARRKFRDYVLERRDPRRRPYYWIWGERLSEFEKDTDAHVVHIRKGISVTPLNLDLVAKPQPSMKGLELSVSSKLAQLAWS